MTDCPFCGCATGYRTPKHADYVVDGKPICLKEECRKKAVAAIQGVQLALQLGIGRRPEDFQLPLRLNPG